MKIVFICGCLEFGFDGVGDYTRNLAMEMKRNGHEVALIAFNDRFITHCREESERESHMHTLRIPAIWKTEQRIRAAKNLVDAFNPDWISLQYVIFSFHKKGLPLFLGNQLLKIGRNRRWHIMFHELWVGMMRETSLKMYLWGQLQKKLIGSMLGKIKPKLIHTQSRLYQSQLQVIKWQAGYLPLFPNISVYAAKQSKKIATQLQTDKWISFVVFATISPGTMIEEFSMELSQYAENNGYKIRLTMIGNNGNQCMNWSKICRNAGFEVIERGVQTPENISMALSQADFGISTATLAYLDKSGTVATMLAHGLPVIVVSKPVKLRNNFHFVPSEGIFAYQPGYLASVLTSRQKISFHATLDKVSSEFETSLLRFQESGVHELVES